MDWIDDKDELSQPDQMKLEKLLYLLDEPSIQVKKPTETPLQKLIKNINGLKRDQS